MRSALTRVSCIASSEGPITVVAALVWACGVGVPVAVTTMARAPRPAFGHQVALDVIELARVKAGRLQLSKRAGGDDEVIAAFNAGDDLKAAVGRGDGGPDDVALAEQIDDCTGDLYA